MNEWMNENGAIDTPYHFSNLLDSLTVPDIENVIKYTTMFLLFTYASKMF